MSSFLNRLLFTENFLFESNNMRSHDLNERLIIQIWNWDGEFFIFIAYFNHNIRIFYILNFLFHKCSFLLFNIHESLCYVYVIINFRLLLIFRFRAFRWRWTLFLWRGSCMWFIKTGFRIFCSSKLH